MNRTQAGQLDDLAAAAIRPACAADLPSLGDFFAGLSMEARYLRFFAPTTPGRALLKVLCGGDGTADAVLATRDAVIVGHAMAADRCGPGGTRTTDIGVVVADAWQGKGVGSALVRAVITRAQARGVSSVTMDVLHGNQRVLTMISGHWPAARARRSRDFDTICVPLRVGRPHQPHGRGGRVLSGKPALHRRRVPAEIAVAGVAKQGGEPVGLIVESQPVHGRE